MRRDVDADYRRAYLDQYQRARRAGRTNEADHVADVLRDRFGHDVEPKTPPPPDTAPEASPARRTRGPKTRATPGLPPETAVED